MSTETAPNPVHKQALMGAAELTKRYRQARLLSRKKFVIEALIGVSLEITQGSVVGLVGESGSGKSTLASCMALLEKPDSGTIWFAGREISHNRQELSHLRPKIQMVFQDSAGALNPRFSAVEIIAEPLRVQHRGTETACRARARELMEEVGLSPDWCDRRPLEFSGGQRQRIAIARAIALQPSLLILDESLSGLDLSTQAQMLNLLLDLRAAHSLTYVLISHDLGLIGQVADFIAVMQQGRIVEQGTHDQVLRNSQHAYTRQLLGSSRVLETAFRAARAGGGE